MSYELIWEERGLYRRYFGLVTPDEVARSVREFMADPRFDDLRYSISDFTAARIEGIGDHDLQEVASLHFAAAMTNPHLLTASVATDEALLARLRDYKTLAISPYPTEVFASVAAARAWVRVYQRRSHPHPRSRQR